MSENQAQAPKRPRNIKKLLIMTVIVIILIIAIILIVNSLRKVPQNYITASGTIEATEINLGSKVIGRVVVLNVDEGSVVKKGETIAVLSSPELKDAVNQARAAYADAQARLQEAIAGPRIEQITAAQAALAQAQAAVAGARHSVAIAQQTLAEVPDLKAALDAAQSLYISSQATLSQTEAQLKLVQKGPRIEDIRAAQAAVRQARASNVEAQKNLVRIQQLYNQGAVSAQQFDNAQATADTTAAVLAQAQQKLAELQAGSRPEEIAQAQDAVAAAKANLEGARTALVNARTQYNERLQARQTFTSAQAQLKIAIGQEDAARANLEQLQRGTRPEEITQARQQANQAKAALNQAIATYNNLIIKAPSNAVVTTKVAEVGELVNPGGIVVVLSDLNNVWLRVYIPENQLGLIKLNDPSDVTVDTYPNKVFKGRVSEIATQAEFTPKNVQTQQERVKLVFGVKIAVPNENGALKPGMPADASIRIR